MGYRRIDPPKHRHRRDMDNKSTNGVIFLEPGTQAKFSIPCWYRMVGWPIQVHGHDRGFHDHIGWPSPDHPDHSCQEWDFDHSCCLHGHAHCEPKRCHDYIDMCKLHPIHLSEEGYQVQVKVSDVPAPQEIWLRYKDLVNWKNPDEDDLKNAFDKMSEDEFGAYRKWYASKNMNVVAKAEIRKSSDWIVDVHLEAANAVTGMCHLDEAEKIVTVLASRPVDGSDDTKREVLGKFVVKVNDPAGASRKPE